MKVLVTGANGFIGNAVLCELIRRGIHSVGAVRASRGEGHLLLAPSLTHDADWGSILHNVDVVIHSAGMAHVSISADDKRAETLHSVNVLGTARLAQQAASSGVKRFIFLSSIGVNGNSTTVPFRATDTPEPVEPYAVSKLAAEVCLTKICAESGMDLVIVRPPLVYGKGAPGNFSRLVNLVMRGVPLPLGSVDNRRSFVAIDNLVDLLVRCVTHKGARGRVILVSDGEDLSTAEFIRKIAVNLKRPARVFEFPVPLLHFAAAVGRQRALVDRLCGSLQIDITQTCKSIEWTPPMTVDESLKLALGDLRR